MPNSIDLFAGCGGLSRGLEWAGFDCLAFNELNSDAADSFAANFPHAIRLDGDIRTAITPNVIKDLLSPRINEKGGLDLLCGGPPCQGFSGIGHRRTHKLEKKDIPTNHLFHEMIHAIVKLQPKAFLFENVEGILSGRWTDGGEKGEIFRDVWSAFSSIKGYICQPTLIHAYGFGVPQNRPRVMIMGVKKKYCSKKYLPPTKFNPNDTTQSYASQLRNNGGFFPVWDEESIDAPDLIDVLSDLDFEGWSPESKEYRKEANSEFQRFIRGQSPLTGVQKAAWALVRRHSISKCNKLTGTQMASELLPLPEYSRGNSELTEHEFSKHSRQVIERFELMLKKKITKKRDLPPEMRTKKFNQKPLPARWPDKPSMTVTSLPDDYLHYSRPRTFSVREWARMQTFPDSHVFCGKRTTGGSRRAGSPDDWSREVPKYTQIGNAVPPLLGKALGQRILKIIEQ